jgi:subtilisin family serine protease
MRIPRLRYLASILAILLCLASPALGAQYILQLTLGANVSTVTARYGLVVVKPLTHDGQTVYLVTGPDPSTAQFIKQVLENPAVKQFELDAEVESPERPPSSPPIINTAAITAAIQDFARLPYYGATVRDSYVNQPTGALIQLPNALSSYATGSGIVAVIDTGVDPNHPALKGVLVPGYDFIRDQPGYASEFSDLSQSTVAILDQSTVAILDKKFGAVLNQSTVAILDQSTVAILDKLNLPGDFGHGTMVAGLIHWVAPTARIMPLKAFNADGTANLSDIVRAVYYAVDNGAKVINMSFSSLTDSPSLSAAIQYASSHSVFCIASAGNDGKKIEVYPAGDSGVVGVGSTSALDKRSFFSNYGTRSVRTAAPGEALITTYPGNNYAGVWGTSFSTALTSGAFALMLQVNPRLKPGDISDALEHGKSLDIDGMGDARLDVLTMVMYCMSEH